MSRSSCSDRSAPATVPRLGRFKSGSDASVLRPALQTPGEARKTRKALAAAVNRLRNNMVEKIRRHNQARKAGLLVIGIITGTLAATGGGNTSERFRKDWT